MNTAGTLIPTGELSIEHIQASGAPLAWKLHNVLHWKFIRSWLGVKVVRPIAKTFGLMTGYSTLEATHIKGNGEKVYYGVVSYRVITTTGVGFITDAWRNTVELEIMKYHGAGTGAGAEAAGDTALGTESTTALNPDNTRATGTLAGSGTTFQTVGTLTFDATAAITEHGILSQAATGGGVLWDRSVFSAINVVSGDSIQFTYTATLTAGG